MMIRAIKCEPHKEAVECQINDDLKSLQEAVGGYIEFVYPFDREVAILCNEEGKLDGLDISRPILDDDNNILDLIAGTCYIIGITSDGGNRDLTDTEIAFYKNYFRYPVTPFMWEFVDADGERQRILDIQPHNEKGRKVKAYGR